MWNHHTEEIVIDTEVNSQALSDACSLLFGKETDASPEFIRYMQIAGLKAAFRNLAMRNHPDLATQIGVAAPVLQQRFTEIRHAYELLLPYVAGEKPLPPWQAETDAPENRYFRVAPRPARPAAYSRSPMTRAPKAGSRITPRRPAPSGKQTFASGKVPRRALRFGEFLYYHGKVSWENMFSALVWQRLSRPRLGEIALEQRVFTASDMLDLRRFRQVGELVGETAKRLGIIDDSRLRMLLAHQKLYRAPIGRYFTEEKLLTEFELAQFLNLQRAHNLSCGKK
jgi:hypothetical protein